MRITPRDNVAVALSDQSSVPAGHKKALCPIKKGEKVIKYGFPIGFATANIQPGEWVHTHNVHTLLDKELAYRYRPSLDWTKVLSRRKTFDGYLRPDGQAGVRNEIWILPTVGCVNRTAIRIAEQASQRWAGRGIDGVYAWPHPYGCSQMGEDQQRTQALLAGLTRNPNAGGVLVLGLGCENNQVDDFQKVLGGWDENRVKFLIAQQCGDELLGGAELIDQLAGYAARMKRTALPASMLRVGLKCGGSDGFSGITANPLLGNFSDRLVSLGGSSALTEVPEMFGAETILMDRAADEAVFEKIVRMVNGFKAFYARHGQVVYENPSPGNKAGGITTLEDKSLGCTQKGGTSPVIDVLGYGRQMEKPGLNLCDGPGNDMVACTVLAAAGAQMILFTTGRGTPLGGPVPTVKVSTNSALAKKKPHWIDFDAGRLLGGASREGLEEEFFDFVLSVASGQQTANEKNGYREITLFRTGVTL